MCIFVIKIYLKYTKGEKFVEAAAEHGFSYFILRDGKQRRLENAA